MKTKKRKVLNLIKTFAIFLLTALVSSCPNGVEFTPRGLFPAKGGGLNADGGSVKLPEFDSSLPPGDNIFKVALTSPVSAGAADGYQVVGFNPAFIGELFITDKAPAEKIAFSFNLTIEDIADDLVIPAKGENPEKIESGAIRLTAQYTKETGSDSFAEIFIDGKAAKKADGTFDVVEIKKARAGSVIPVELIFDNTAEACQGLVTLTLAYAAGIYDANKNFDKVRLFVYSIDPSSGGSGKPVYKLASLIQKDADVDLKSGESDYTAVLTDSAETQAAAAFTANFTARFLNVAADKPLLMQVVSATEGITVSGGQKNSRSVGTASYDFAVQYKNPARAFAHNTGTAVLRFEPAAGSADYYGGQAVEITVNFVRKPSLRFFKPEFTVSTADENLNDRDGYYTRLVFPAVDESVLYKIWRKDDSGAGFKQLSSATSTAGVETVVKDYHALVYYSATQEYKVQIESGGEKSLESNVFEGSRQLTAEEFLIAAGETIRYAFIDDNGGIHNGNTETRVTGANGGLAKHLVSYHPAIGYEHKYTFSQYTPFFASVGAADGNLLSYKRSGGTWVDIANNGSGGTLAPKAPLGGLLQVVTPFGSGKITLVNIAINNNTWNNPLWSSGEILVEYNGKTVKFTKDNWFIPFYMSKSAFETKINASNYTQRNGGTVISGVIY